MGPRLLLAPRRRDAATPLARAISGPGGMAGSGTPPTGTGDPSALPRDYELAGKVGGGAGCGGSRDGPPKPCRGLEVGASPSTRSGGDREGSGDGPGVLPIPLLPRSRPKSSWAPGRGKEAAAPAEPPQPCPPLPRGVPDLADVGMRVPGEGGSSLLRVCSCPGGGGDGGPLAQLLKNLILSLRHGASPEISHRLMELSPEAVPPLLPSLNHFYPCAFILSAPTPFSGRKFLCLREQISCLLDLEGGGGKTEWCSQGTSKVSWKETLSISQHPALPVLPHRVFAVPFLWKVAGVPGFALQAPVSLQVGLRRWTFLLESCILLFLGRG